MNEVKRIYSTGEAAKLLNVAPRTVCKWFDSGRLKGYRVPGSQDRRIPREKLKAFLVEHGMMLPAELEDKPEPAKCKYGFTPDPQCNNCDGSGDFSDDEPCHFCMSDAIRRGELDGMADDVLYVGGKPIEPEPA